MSDLPSAGPQSLLQANLPAIARRRRWRMFLDRLVSYLVALGGNGVIIAITLIFFYLAYVVLPLFKPAEAVAVAAYVVPGGTADRTLALAMEEQAEIGVRFTRHGRVVFFRTQDGQPLLEEHLTLPQGVQVTSFAMADPASGVAAFGLSDGTVYVVRHAYAASYPGDQRVIAPALEFPLGDEPLVVDDAGHALARLALQNSGERATVVAATEDGRLLVSRFEKQVSFLDDTVTLERQAGTLTAPDAPVTQLLLEPEQRRLYVADEANQVSFFDLSDLDAPSLVQRLPVVAAPVRISTMRLLSGGVSLLVGGSDGSITQWFPVRDEENRFALTRVRGFDDQKGPITDLATEYYRKGFLAAGEDGAVGIYHATAHRILRVKQVVDTPLRHLAIGPRADAMLAEDDRGQLHFWRIDNKHPEVSWSSLWGKVWYEGYSEPAYVWQSSAANEDFEPKFSLVPISFGTLKAAFYAMLLAVPMSIFGAIFTAHFMAPQMRSFVKPVVEIMEALPTVILGFLAGLWLAPFLENHLPGIFAVLLLMPMGVVLFGYVWSRVPIRWRHRVPDGWEAALLIPAVILVGWFSIAASPLLEQWFFGGDMRLWLTHDLGINFDQRNSIVVGLAMGFAVIPTIFSITEDAIFGVPKHLAHGSLALGATPWQTLTKVVILTASPGIFSAVMIGLGRAVGETMIVLMATGNTPVMDMSLFEGMRTLSANIAVEMPESEVNSTHFRVLFLAALVLFLFTFVFNTLAEVVRQRLRRKYSNL